MPNEVFRERLKSMVDAAKRRANEAGLVDRQGVSGQIREIAARELIAPLLRAGFKIGTGKIIDANGGSSKQTDIVVYDSRILPLVMFDEQLGAFPVECCTLVVEVKSVLSRPKLKESVENLRSIESLKLDKSTQSAAVTLSRGGTIPWPRALFAFKSDLSARNKSEIDRLRKIDPNADSRPAFDRLCIVGRGYWKFIGHPDARWLHFAPTTDHDEVIEIPWGDL